MKNIEKKIKKYLVDRNWDKPLPGDIAKSISIEVAELLEYFQWNNKSIKELKKDTQKILEIEEELADVFIYCLNMSVLFGFNTEKIILDKIKKIDQKYPAHLFKNKKIAETESEDIYWKIKKEHRKKK